MTILRAIVKAWCRLTYRSYDHGFSDFDQSRVAHGVAEMQHRTAHTA